MGKNTATRFLLNPKYTYILGTPRYHRSALPLLRVYLPPFHLGEHLHHLRHNHLKEDAGIIIITVIIGISIQNSLCLLPVSFNKNLKIKFIFGVLLCSILT